MVVRLLGGDVELHWWVLPVLVLVTGPLAVLANAAEFRIMGAVNGHHIRWAPAVRLTVLAASANLLPLPGGVLVRTQALYNRGSTYRHAVGANAAAGLVWIGCAALVIAALCRGRDMPGWVALCAAAAGRLGTGRGDAGAENVAATPGTEAFRLAAPRRDRGRSS